MKIVTLTTIELVRGRIPKGVTLVLERRTDGFIYLFTSECGNHRLHVSEEHFKHRLDIDYIKVEENMNGNEIKRGDYIIGSINKQTGELSFSKTPKVHANQGSAVAEAKRLAENFSQKKFVVVEVKAIARTVEVVVE